MMKQTNTVHLSELEAIFRADARNPAETMNACEMRVAMAEMAPHIARESARLRRKRKNRREAALMALAMSVVLTMMLFCAAALRYGESGLFEKMGIIALTVSALSLLTLPLMEKFLPEKG